MLRELPERAGALRCVSRSVEGRSLITPGLITGGQLGCGHQSIHGRRRC